MDLVVLDTETTGLEVSEGHRVIELGCVLLSNRKHTETRFHHYINPGRAIDAEAREVHGISEAFLEDKPAFSEIMGEFLTFVKGTELVIHNAPFDLGFLNRELELAGHSLRLEEVCEVTDSLALARQMHPGQRNSLDALCRRYEVDNSGRELHGALLDAEILADVYLAMTGGQTTLSLAANIDKAARHNVSAQDAVKQRSSLKIIYADETELSAHKDFLDKIQ